MTLEAGSAILIVDDDPVFADVLARSLKRRGFEALIAHTPDEAERVMQASAPRYAVVDLKLERASGLTVLDRLKALEPEVTMLVLTGYSSIATAVAAIKRGAVDYACKPLDADEILAYLGGEKSSTDTGAASDAAAQPPSVRRLQWEHIQRVLDEHDGNVSATARALGMHRRTLQRMLQKRPVRR